jgi:hypothetical protein
MRNETETSSEVKTEIVTVAQILAAATPMFEDPAVMSVNVQAKWGIATVLRDGSVFAY